MDNTMLALSLPLCEPVSAVIAAACHDAHSRATPQRNQELQLQMLSTSFM